MSFPAIERRCPLNVQSVGATGRSAKELNLAWGGVDRNALDVVRRLVEARFQALLVGGCVRDLLLGAAPKDFDVATDATPQQVRRLFSRSRLVGRRFKIAHVYYGRNIVEVSTFRRGLDGEEARGQASSADGLILRDNAYGTLEEDAFRRDFTVNALYYDPQEDEILDFVGGLEDLERRRLRFIGPARERLLEDPVRLLRALRFQAKLGFDLDADITADIDLAAQRLAAIPPARLFEEFNKMFLAGFAAEAWRILAPTPVRAALFPAAPPDSRLIRLAMANTDQRIVAGKPVTPSFLLAALLWEDFRARMDELLAARDGERKFAEAARVAAQASIAAQRQTISMPRRHSSFMDDVWLLQERLEIRRPKNARRALHHPRFRAAYDLLKLRSEAGLANPELARWWTEIQEADGEQRATMLDALTEARPRKPRRRRGRRHPRSRPATDSA